MLFARPHRRNQHSPRSGAVVVEFAIVAPVFLLILFALFEFSWLNVVRHTADNAAYEAARRAMVPGATADDAIREANRILSAVGTRSAVVTVNPSPIRLETSQVTVSIDIPVRKNALISPLFTGNLVLRSQSTLRTERAQQGPGTPAPPQSRR